MLTNIYRTANDDVNTYVSIDGPAVIIKSSNKEDFFTVYVPSSIGCKLKCSFCYFTNSDFKYAELSLEQIISKVREAIKIEVEVNPAMRKKYIRLNWSEIGEPFLLNPRDIRKASNSIFTWAVRDTGCAWGVDGVDINTILPINTAGWLHQMALLNDDIDNYNAGCRRSPNNNLNILYSLITSINRKDHIPYCRDNSPSKDVGLLMNFKEWYGVDVGLNHVFIEGINSSKEDFKFIVDNIHKDTKIYIRRFMNHKEISDFKEASNFEDLVSLYKTCFNNVYCADLM